MTGRYAANAGLSWPLFPGSPAGLPSNIPTMPELLKEFGYNTAMSGKWHLGNSQWKQTPVGRGFDVHVGNYMWDLDYISKEYYYEPWQPVVTDWIKAFANGTYHHYKESKHTTDIITEEAIQMMIVHNKSQSELTMKEPLFLYVAYTACHSPLQAEERDLIYCNHIKHEPRRQFCGLLMGVDRNLEILYKSVLEYLGTNTIFVLTSDNGGSPWFGGMNAPYRSGKTTPFQGGVLVPAVALDLSPEQDYFYPHPSILKVPFKRIEYRAYDRYFHLSDWLPTLLGFSRLSVADQDLYFDGNDLSESIRWHTFPYVAGNAGTTLARLESSGKVDPVQWRDEILLEMYFSEDTCFHTQLEAYILGEMKYIYGDLTDIMWYSDPSVNTTSKWLRYRHASLVYMGWYHVLTDFENGFMYWMYQLELHLLIRIGEIMLSSLEWVFGSGAFDTTRIFLTHSVILPLLMEIHERMYVPSGSSDRFRYQFLFNLSSDPLEMHPLPVHNYPHFMEEIENRLANLKAYRVPTQAFWMQLDNVQEWPKTFMRAGAGQHPVHAKPSNYNITNLDTMYINKHGNRCIPASECFVHPWYKDDADIWKDPLLINGYDVAFKKLTRASLIAYILTLPIILIFCYILCVAVVRIIEFVHNFDYEAAHLKLE